jgi:alpha-L-fucosidase
VPGLRNEVRSAWLLATDKTLETTAGAEGVTVEVPAEALDPIDTVVVLEVRGEPQVERMLPKQEADGSMILPAPAADVHAPGSGAGPQVETIDGQPSLGFWTNARAWIGWAFQIDKPGRFDIVATLATPAASSKFVIAVGEQKLPAEASSTGSYQAFQTVKLGTAELKEKGTYELSIRPVRGQWQPINLRCVVLRPAP